MHRAARSTIRGWRTLRQFLWPARSLITNLPNAVDGPFLPEEFNKLSFIHGRGCQQCARPLDIETAALLDSPCAACLAEPPLWTQARAALFYDDFSAKLILGLKHAGRRDGLKVLCNWMVQAGEDILAKTDWLVPVPLHYQRLAKRGYNQSAWLAQGISQQSGTLVLIDALSRKRATPSQAGLTARQRYSNVDGAFQIRPSRANRIRGATVTLIDDVFTTGSTLQASSQALLDAGAAEVNILVLARVVRGKDLTI